MMGKCWLPPLLACLFAACAHSEEPSPLTVVAVGATGVGKSETCNTLVEHFEFAVSRKMKSETREVSGGSTMHRGTRIDVYDTPGVFDTSLSEEQVEGLITPIAYRSELGIDAFLIVFPFGRWTQENSLVYEKLKNMFGPQMLKHAIPVFTKCGDTPDQEVVDNMEDACKTEPSSGMCMFAKQADMKRAVCFGDIRDDARKARDRSRLFDVVFQAVQENHGSKYTNKQFERVQGARSKLSQRISKLPADLQELPNKLMDDLRLGRTSEDRVEAAIKGEEQKANQRAKDHEEQRKQQEAQKQREEDLRRQEGDLRRMMEEHLQRERDRMQQELQLERERQDKEDARARDALWWTAVADAAGTVAGTVARSA